MGLGAYPAISLAKARARAAACRTQVEEGLDPINERDRETEPTFGKTADLLIASMEASWRNDKHRAQWRMTLETYCDPIRSKRVSLINTEDVLRVLKPIWTSKPETASRLRGRVERVLDFAAARGWRSSENPARWRGHLKSVLPPRVLLSRGHHAAMPYDDLPAFLVRLQNAEAMAARALEFLILTAARSGEVLGATWSEFDLDAHLWTVPASRMKAAREHRVPLNDRALAIVTALAEARISEFVFPGLKRDRPLSASAMQMLLRRLQADQFTTHGFRSAFRDWVGDQTSFAREVAEAALAHRVGDATERAYRRADALKKRRELMKIWERFCTGDKVVELSGARVNESVS
jgi:integrase